jgi:hypothetical protein
MQRRDQLYLLHQVENLSRALIPKAVRNAGLYQNQHQYIPGEELVTVYAPNWVS